jgi:hypothetical protein
MMVTTRKRTSTRSAHRVVDLRIVPQAAIRRINPLSSEVWKINPYHQVGAQQRALVRLPLWPGRGPRGSEISCAWRHRLPVE